MSRLLHSHRAKPGASLWGMRLLLLFLVMLQASCKKENYNPPPDTNPPVTTATLQFIVKFAPDSALPDVFVGIAANESDRDAGNYIRSGFTSATGRLSLDALQPIPWYYQVTWNENGSFHSRKDSVHTDSGRTRVVNVYF